MNYILHLWRVYKAPIERCARRGCPAMRRGRWYRGVLKEATWTRVRPKCTGESTSNV